jgi:hypothetical protein
MKIGTLLMTGFALSLTQAAFAGVPLKGVGVSLGKTSGDGSATRTTDANGQTNSGAHPKLHDGAAHTGKSPIVVDSARVRSHSNTTNN